MSCSDSVAKLQSLQTLPAHASLSRRRATLAPLERASSGTFRRKGQYFTDSEKRTDRRRRRRRPRPEMSHLLCVEDEREEGEVGRHQFRASHDARDLRSEKENRLRHSLGCNLGRESSWKKACPPSEGESFTQPLFQSRIIFSLTASLKRIARESGEERKKSVKDRQTGLFRQFRYPFTELGKNPRLRESRLLTPSGRRGGQVHAT